MGRPILDSIDRLEEALGECQAAFIEKGLEMDSPPSVNDLPGKISEIQGGVELETRVAAIEADYLKSTDLAEHLQTEITEATDEDIKAIFAN